MHGIIVLDKPTGPTSAAALAPLKRCLGKQTRVGHAGTLDPLASGVLLALVGDATRLSSLAMGLEKTYEAVVRFGVETTTLDAAGEAVRTADPGDRPPPHLAGLLAGFVGEIDQVPPAYSALKVGGRRAYRLARSGEVPDLAPRRVHIREVGPVRSEWPEVTLRVVCGAGTYIRSLARDIGVEVGLPASLRALRRTAIGPFTADVGIAPGDAADLRLLGEHLRPPRELARAAGLEEVHLFGDSAVDFAHGRILDTGTAADRGSTVAAFDGVTGELLGLGEVLIEGRIRAAKVLASQRDRLLGYRPTET